MNYKEMIMTAQKSGKTTEKQMWQSIESVSDLLCDIKDAHPDLYWRFLREQAGIMNNGHYDEVWANWDVSQIQYTDKDGKAHKGAYWTCEQIEEATKGMSFPAGTTRWDKFVAFNLAWSDFCKKFDDAQILQIGYLFFFADEDWSADGKGSSTKTWDYICCKYKK